MADEEVNKLAAATAKLRENEAELAEARESQEKSLRAMIDSANVDIGLKDWTKGLTAGLEDWADDMTIQLVLLNEKMEELINSFQGPDTSVATETALESRKEEGGDVKKPMGLFGKGFKKIGEWIKKFLAWKTLIIGVLAAIVGGLAIKYWEPIKEFVVDKIIPAIEKIVEVLAPIVQSIGEWITNTALPAVIDFFFNSIDNMKELFESVTARFESWGEMDFKEKVFAILGVFEDLGTYIANVGRNLFVAIGELFGADGEALAQKYFDPIRQVFSDLIDWVKLAFTDPKAALSALWSGLLGGAATIGDWIWDNAIEPPISWVMDKFAWAGDIAAEGWTTLKDFITGIYTDTIDFWTRKFAAIGDLAVEGWTNLKDFVTGAFESVVFFFQDMFRWSKDIVVEGFHNLTDFIIDTYNKVVEFFTRMFAWGGDIIKEGWNGVTGFVTGVYDQVIDFFTRMFAWGGDIVSETWTGLTGFITDAYDGVVGFFTDKFTFVSDALEGFSLTDTIREAAQNIKDFFWNDKGTGLLNFDFAQVLPDFDFKNLFGDIADMFSISSFLDKIGSKIRDEIKFPFGFDWLRGALLKIFPPETGGTVAAAPGAQVYQGPDSMANAEMANKVYKKPETRPGFPAVISAPTTDNSVTSAPTFNFRGRGSAAAASDSYTLAQGRNQRSRFSN